MRSFAQVEHPHWRQRPVPFSATASHSGHARQIASRVARVSGVTDWNPLEVQDAKDFAKLIALRHSSEESASVHLWSTIYGALNGVFESSSIKVLVPLCSVKTPQQ